MVLHTFGVAFWISHHFAQIKNCLLISSIILWKKAHDMILFSNFMKIKLQKNFRNGCNILYHFQILKGVKLKQVTLQAIDGG